MNVNTAEDGQRVRMWSVQPVGQALVLPIPDGIDPTLAIQSVERLLDKQPITRFPDYCPVGITDQGQLVVRGLGHDTMDIQRFGGEIRRSWARAANWHRHKWIVGALVVGLLAFATLQANATERQWGDWTYQDEGLRDLNTDRVAGFWESVMFTDQGYVLGSQLVVEKNGIRCMLSYWPVVGPDSDRPGWWKFQRTGDIQYVAFYESLPVAMRNCREAIERKLDLTLPSRMASEAGRSE